MSETYGEFDLDPFQSRLVNAGVEASVEGRSGGIQAPTGAGKSVIEGITAARVAHIFKEQEQGRKVLLIQPKKDLLDQNFQKLKSSGLAEGLTFSRISERNDKIFDHKGNLVPYGLSGDVILMTSMALVRNIPDLKEGLESLAQKGSVILGDEGHRSGASRLSQILEGWKASNGSGVLYSAHFGRCDGKDPLSVFDASLDKDLLAVAHYEEVLESGRIVPPKFSLQRARFADENREAFKKIHTTYEDMICRGKSPELASEKSFSQFFNSDEKDDRLLGKMIQSSVGRIWRDEAHDRKTTLAHTLGTETAFALAEGIRGDGQWKGRDVSVACIVHGSVGVLTGKGDWVIRKGTKAREAFLNEARQGRYDVIVNCGVLNEGTDIPVADMTMILAQGRSLSPTVQMLGRTARQNEGKTDHKVVDIGSTIEAFGLDIKAMREGKPDLARASSRKAGSHNLEDLGRQFDQDPALWECIEKDTTRYKAKDPVGKRTAPESNLSLGDYTNPTDTRHGDVLDPLRFSDRLEFAYLRKYEARSQRRYDIAGFVVGSESLTNRSAEALGVVFHPDLKGGAKVLRGTPDDLWKEMRAYGLSTRNLDAKADDLEDDDKMVKLWGSANHRVHALFKEMPFHVGNVRYSAKAESEKDFSMQDARSLRYLNEDVIQSLNKVLLEEGVQRFGFEQPYSYFCAERNSPARLGSINAPSVSVCVADPEKISPADCMLLMGSLRGFTASDTPPILAGKTARDAEVMRDWNQRHALPFEKEASAPIDLSSLSQKNSMDRLTPQSFRLLSLVSSDQDDGSFCVTPEGSDPIDRSEFKRKIFGSLDALLFTIKNEKGLVTGFHEMVLNGHQASVSGMTPPQNGRKGRVIPAQSFPSAFSAFSSFSLQNQRENEIGSVHIVGKVFDSLVKRLNLKDKEWDQCLSPRAIITALAEDKYAKDKGFKPLLSEKTRSVYASTMSFHIEKGVIPRERATTLYKELYRTTGERLISYPEEYKKQFQKAEGVYER